MGTYVRFCMIMKPSTYVHNNILISKFELLIILRIIVTLVTIMLTIDRVKLPWLSISSLYSWYR